MKLNLECIPCFLMQALKASRFCRLGEEEQEKVLREVMTVLLNERWDKTPPELAHVVHAVVRKYGGDPYLEIKRKSNELALKLYPEVKEIVESSEDPLKTAVKVSIAGNIIDFGAVDEELTVDHYKLFKEKLKSGNSILYFADNAGEIVFDRILIVKRAPLSTTPP